MKQMSALRGMNLYGLCLIGCLAMLACAGGEEVTAVHPLSLDPRIAPYLGGGRISYYDRDTQDVVSIQVQKLNGTGGDPLHRAKEELGEMGTSAAIELRRVFDANFTNQRGIPFLENALDAAALNRSQEAHDMIMAALDHPMEAVRQRAISGLIAAHARPEDFQELKLRFETNDTPAVRRKYLRAMFLADPVRAEQAALEWIQRDEMQSFMAGMMTGLEGSTRPETGLLCGLIYPDVSPLFAVQMAATAARFGDASALAYVQGELNSNDGTRQLRAVQAFGKAEMYSELKNGLSGSLSGNVRILVIQNLSAAAQDNPEIQGWMATGLTDQSASVRDFTLVELCKVGYEPALDQALAQLNGRVELLQPALIALQSSMAKDPQLASRAFDILTRRYAEELAASDELHGRTLKAIGLIPGRSSAEFLRRRALELGELKVEGMGVHSWVMIAASNTGEQGLGYLFDCLAEERDATRRIDLIDAIASVREDSSRLWLFALLEGEQDPYEALFTAAQLVQMGPSKLVASRIKTYCLKLEHVPTRRALQALLWKWY